MTVHLNFDDVINNIKRTDSIFRYIVHCVYADYLEIGDAESINKMNILCRKFRLTSGDVQRMHSNFNVQQKKIIFEL